MNIRFHCRLSGALLSVAFSLGLASQAKAQQVYVGVADQWDDLLKKPDQWKFVRENVDGLYVNFIEMNWLKNEPKKFNAAKLARTAALFTHKNAILESDHKDASIEDDQRYLTQLRAAGFTVPLTSLNYGWSLERANNLKSFNLLPGQTPRQNLVQNGPWVLGGDITLANPDNDKYRANVDRSDGISTDGPMGFWLSDQGKMRAGSISMVKYAHAHGQKALIMLCPYGAQNKFYNPTQALTVSQECVREHEDAGAIPDIWAVFEYATSISAVPEQIDGVPISSTTGMAYWLLHHLKDPNNAARLTVVPQTGLTTSVRPALATEKSDRIKEVSVAQIKVPVTGTATSQTVTYELRNSSSWLDLCPVLTAKSNNPNWDIRATLNEVDVTGAILGAEGVACTGDFRLWHDGAPSLPPHKLQITVTPRAIANKVVAPLDLSLTLSPHPSYRELVEQRLNLKATAQ